MNKRNITFSTILVVFVTLLIKIIGLIKQSVVAFFCGASVETDIFYLATGLVTAISAIIFSSITINLQKSYIDRLSQEGRESANNLLSSSLKLFLSIAIFISLLFFAAAPLFSRFMAPSYDAEQTNTLIKYIRILSISFVLTAYYFIVDIVLLADRRFLPGKIQALLQNIFIVVSAVFFYNKAGVDSFIYSVILSMILQCILITFAARKRFFPKLRTKPEHKELKNIFLVTLPILFGNALFEINDIIDRRIAIGLGEGNVSYLTYGSSINEMVTTLIVTSLASVLFTNFSLWISNKETEKVSYTLKKSCVYLFLIIIPIMSLCFACPKDVVSVLYGRGHFGEHDVIQTSLVVVGYACGFLFQAIRAVMIRAYYSFGNTRFPMIDGLIIVVLNISLSVLLSLYIGVSGIAFATSISMFAGTVILLPGIKKMLPTYKPFESFGEYLKIFLAGIASLIGCLLIKSVAEFNSFLNLLVFGLITILIYFIFLLLMRCKCLIELVHKIKVIINKKTTKS